MIFRDISEGRGEAIDLIFAQTLVDQERERERAAEWHVVDTKLSCSLVTTPNFSDFMLDQFPWRGDRSALSLLALAVSHAMPHS